MSKTDICNNGVPIFTVRQLQEKCREQRMPLYLGFIDLTKAFDLVSRKGLFRLLEKIGCPPKLRSMITSVSEDMKGTVLYDGSMSEPFPIKSGVKQGCVLAPSLFGTFFSVLLSYAFSSSTERIYIHTRSDGSLFSTARLHAKTKTREVLDIPKQGYTTHVSSAPFCMAVRRGQPTCARSVASTPSTCAALNAYLKSLGKITSLTAPSWRKARFQASSLCCHNDASAGLATCTVWMTAAYQRTFFMVNLPKEQGKLDAHP